MGKPGKRRWDGKQRQPQKKRETDKKTPEALIAQGNFQEAVRLLRAHIRMAPTDEKKRLLGQSLCELRDLKEAANAWLTIQEKTWHDLAMIGAVYLDLEEWDQAVPHLQASLKLEEVGSVYYWLAVAQGKNRTSYQLNAEESASIVGLLQKARPLPGCPVEAFLWLDDLVRRGKDHEEERATLLQEALARYPDADEVRLRLGSQLLYYLGNYEGALTVVRPLLDQPDPPQLALALAFWAAQKGGLFEQALAYTECMQKSPYHCYGPGLSKVKGDLYLTFGKMDEAISLYEQEIQSGDFTAMFIGFFSIAAARLRQQQAREVLAAAAQGAHLWFANPNDSQCSNAVFLEPVYVGKDADSVHLGDESLSECLKDVCVVLLAEGQQVDLPLKGQLSYLLFNYHRNHASDEPEEALTALLLQAAAWFDHPRMGLDLARHYKTVGDLPLAVEHHLAYCLWQFATLKTYQPFPPVLVGDDADESRRGWMDRDEWMFQSSTAEFDFDDETEEGDEEDAPASQKMTEAVRRMCHETAWELLQAQQDSDTIIVVFLPFYRSFWYRILIDSDMHQEIVDVTALLLKVSPDADVDNELWDYAYSSKKLGNADEAERAYRSYLERYPDHANTLHNLALLVEEQGLLQEALALSSRAAALAPHDETIVQENSRFKGEYEKQEKSRGSAAEQERLHTSSQGRAHLWSLLSNSQKRLLCLMELYPSAHWSALLPYVKNDEHQLRQLQEDWEWLLAHEMCLQAEADTSVRAVPLLQPCVLEEGFQCWLSSEIARVQARKKKNLWLPEATDLGDEQLAHLDSIQRDLMQQALMRQIERVGLSGLEQFHLRFYRRVWKQLLIEWKMYAALVDLCERFLTRLPIMTRQELWECAYYATDLSGSYQNIAEKRYKEYLAQGKGYAAYHNLSIIYLKRDKYHDALQMIEQALELNPSNEGSLNQKALIEQAIQEEEEKQAQLELQQQRKKERREQHLKDLEQNIQAHLAEVVNDYHKKRILQALNKASYFYSKQSFAKYIAMEDYALNGHWRKLVAWGMIIEDGRQTTVHPLVSTYLEHGWPVVSEPSAKTKEHQTHIALSRTEIARLVNQYIGVSGGYLGDFTYPTHAAFYPEYCDLDINPDEYDGTTRQRFITILSSLPPRDQAAIVRGVLYRFPVGAGPAIRTAEARNEFLQIIQRLESGPPVPSEVPGISSDVVLRAITDADLLLEVFCCYAREDQEMLEHLKKHLVPLERQGQITVWSDTNLNAGVEWEKELHQHLESADIILLLISPDFMASDYCYSTEMERAIARHNEGSAQVIPILLSSTFWQNAPFAKLQIIPTNAKPVTNWPNRDDALHDITMQVNRVVSELQTKRARHSVT